MKQLAIVKNPTTINGRTLKFGALYGKIDGITYTVESYDETTAKTGTLLFWVYREERVVTTKKHGTYVTGGYWHKVNSLASGKYAQIVAMCNEYITSHKLWLRQPTDYIRNSEILAIAKDCVRRSKCQKPAATLPKYVTYTRTY